MKRLTTSVLKLPSVRTTCALKAWNPRITAITATTAEIGLISGMVMKRNRANAPAPSSEAASYSSRGTF